LSLDLLRSESFFRVLFKIDRDLAEEHRSSGCRHTECKGVLHSANYGRQPRGELASLPDEYSVRRSFCCSICRARSLPPSCLFFGRRVYWGCVVLLAVALRQGRTDRPSVAKLRKMLGVSRQTIKRWMTYFREIFATTTWWQRLRGHVPPVVRNDNLPADFLTYVRTQEVDDETALVRVLHLIQTGRSPTNLASVSPNSFTSSPTGSQPTMRSSWA